MNERQNLIKLIKKEGYEWVPVDINMTPDLSKRFWAYVKKKGYKVPPNPFANAIGSMQCHPKPKGYFRKFYKEDLKADTKFDRYGVAMEAGSEACGHLRRYYHPLANATTLEEIESYPFPKLHDGTTLINKLDVLFKKMSGKFVMGSMQMTVWEQSWYVRSMEAIMMDMMCEPELADAVLDRVMKNAIISAKNFARAGVDGIYLGDDIGMQSTTIMSEEMFVTFIKPRLKAVIDGARSIKPDVIIFYHSCGYIEPFIPHLIDIGVDVLNPIQPECMDFEKIFKQYGDQLAFCGTIGTQTVMPFGTPDDVKKKVKENLDIVGAKGGLIVSPTHILEPEVPLENIVAYIEACKEYKVKR